MPNIKSAKKRVKVTATKNLQNRMFNSALKTVVKKYMTALEAGDKEAAAVVYQQTVSKIDKAVAKGLMAKNTAARHKSRFTRLLNQMA